jgi:DNA-binding MarR family transcriptional regulator
MPTLAEISAKADELQTALDAEQQQVATLLAEKDATIATLGETITELEAQIVDGGTTEERQALLDKLIALKDDLESTVTPPEPPIEG